MDQLQLMSVGHPYYYFAWRPVGVHGNEKKCLAENLTITVCLKSIAGVFSELHAPFEK